jgi:hypothetical protein
MTATVALRALLSGIVLIALADVGFAQAPEGASAAPVNLLLPSGRPLRVALDARVRLKKVGDVVTATLVEPIYAYDRVVISVGARVRGHVAQLTNPPKATRIKRFLSGNFSPNRTVVIQFDTIVLPEGRELPIETRVGPPAERVALQVAANPKTAGKDADGSDADPSLKQHLTGQAKQAVVQAGHDVAQKAHDAVTMVKDPRRMERLKAMAYDQLPYHPQVLTQGTEYSATLLGPIDFGVVEPPEFAAGGTLPSPDSILTAYLRTPIGSATSTKGAPIIAVLSEPVFSASHELILPEGSELTGKVTFVRKARFWRRNGQVRFLFESVHAPGHNGSPMLASLYSVRVSENDHLVVDEEGGARTTNSNTRFIEPALALLSLRALTHREPRGIDGDADDSLPGTTAGGPGVAGVGGFIGFGLAGTALSMVSHPFALVFTSVGAARTFYTNILGKGSEVSFPADTRIQVRLAPGEARRDK